MELYLFSQDDIEQKINTIKDSIQTLNFAMLGIKDYYDINDDHINSIETVATNTMQDLQCLYDSMTPVLLDWNPEKIAIIFDCEVENADSKKKK